MMETSFILQRVFFVPGELKPIHFRARLCAKNDYEVPEEEVVGLHSDGEREEAPVFAGYYRLRASTVSGGRFKMCSGGRDDHMKKTLTRDGSLHTG